MREPAPGEVGYRMPLEDALRLAYRPDTGLRLDETELEGLKARFVADGVGLTEKVLADGTRKALMGIGYLMLLPHALDLPRHVVSPHAESLSLDELAPKLGTTGLRATFIAAGDRGLRLWAYFTGTVALNGYDPVSIDDPYWRASEICADFAGKVRLLGTHCQELKGRGETELGWRNGTNTLDHLHGSFVYRGAPVRVTLEHVRVLASDILAKPNAQPEEPPEKIPANQRAMGEPPNQLT